MPEKFEDQIRALLDQENIRAATDLILQREGAALYGYVAGIVRDPDLSEDAFQVFSIRLWKSLPAFQWQGSLKNWLYTIARNASYRTLEDPHRRRAQPLTTQEEEAIPAHWNRTVTVQWRRTAEKERLWTLIEAFAAEDREIFILRLGRQMSWREIAEVVSDGADDDAALRRRAAALRKRYERLKKQLREGLTRGPS